MTDKETAEKISKNALRKFNIAYVRDKGFAGLACEIRDEYNKLIPQALAKARSDERERAEKEPRLKLLSAVYALALMWNQYCAKGGHLFMCAGEACLTTLEENDIGGADDYGGEVNTEKIEELIEAAQQDLTQLTPAEGE